MKLKLFFVFLLVYGSLSTSFGQDGKIVLHPGSQPLPDVLEQIQKQSEYRIIYSNEVITDTMMVNPEGDYPSVFETLDRLLPAHQLFYKMLAGKMIVIGGVAYPKSSDTEAIFQVASGQVYDETHTSIPFATIGILRDSVFITGTTGDKHGRFHLRYAFRKGVSYQLKVSSLGYKSSLLTFRYPDTAALKNVVLKREKNVLQTVQVTANRPLVARLADRYVVTVAGSLLATGYNGLEVLERSPGIWVNPDGSITMRGNQSVLIMIDDVVQRMSTADLANYLRTVRSEDISKIEIIPNPPSEFEAEGSGGIIHIILKKGRSDGLQGTVYAQYRQQVKKPYYGTGTTLNYKRKSLYLFGSFNYNKDQSEYIASYHNVYADLSTYDSHTDRYNNNKGTSFRLGAAYDIAKNQSISFQTLGNASRLNQYFDTYIQVTEGNNDLIGTANSIWLRRPLLNSTTLNYALKTDSLGSGLKFIGDYVSSRKTETNNFISHYSDSAQNSNFRNNTPNTTHLYSMQLDFTQVFDSLLQIKTGLKYVNTTRDNEVLNEDLVGNNWITNTRLSNQFIYKEQLLMAYASLAKKIEKFSVKVGLRAEQTYMDGNSITSNTQFERKYLNLFPSVFMLQQLNEASGTAVFLNYSRRLRRPSFSDLNPYRLQFDDYLTVLGNPDLLPEYMHKVETGLTFAKEFSVEVYYAATNNKIAELARVIDGRVIEYQARNFDNSNEYGLSLSAPIQLFKWWKMRNNLALYNLNYRIDEIHVEQNTFYIKSLQTFSFNKLFDADFWIDYRSPYVNSNHRIAYMFTTQIGLSKKVLNNKGQLRLYAADIFNTFREKDITEYEGAQINFYQKRPTRTFGLSFSYNFSSGRKFDNKTIEQSNEEEKGRIGN